MAALDFRADLKLATETLAAVEAAVERAAEDGWRPHLGASQIGGPCDRALWYGFRWATRRAFDGRMLRLFARGQREEDSLSDLLRQAGVTVMQTDPNTGRQFTFSSCDGNFGGSMDGACHGLKESSQWHVLEFKTHSKKSFDDLTSKGVQKSKPMHYAQMQCYMGWTGMDRAMYVAVCKDDDRMHLERVEYDDVEFKRLLNRAARIIESANPPDRISDDPAWYECRLCDHRDICHGTACPAVSCRTCLHSTPVSNAAWHCARHDITPTTKQQKEACDAHRFIPALLANWATVVDASQDDNWVRYQTDHGELVNGPHPHGFESGEIAACEDQAALCDPFVLEVRTDMDARIVEWAK